MQKSWETEMVQKKAKMGRPPRHEGERLSKSRTFRVRPHLDELLMTAAAKAGRSVSEEIEYRLDRSFYEDALPARMAETMAPLVAPLVEQAARAGGEAALAGCGKTEQGSRSDSDPFTSGFGYVHGQNEFFRSLLRLVSSRPETVAEWEQKRQQIEFEGAREGRRGAAFDWLRELMDAFANVYGVPVNSYRELMTWAHETPQGRAAINKILQGRTTPEQK
jgi:hypothetical protein